MVILIAIEVLGNYTVRLDATIKNVAKALRKE